MRCQCYSSLRCMPSLLTAFIFEDKHPKNRDGVRGQCNFLPEENGRSRLQTNNLPVPSMLTSFHETSAERHADLIAKRHVFTGSGTSAEWKKNNGSIWKDGRVESQSVPMWIMLYSSCCLYNWAL